MDEEIFISSLKGLEGIKIGLFLADNQFIEGTLLNVQEDHLTVEVEGKTFYFPISQIKAVSKSAKDNQAVKQPTEIEVAMDGELLESKLNNMLQQWVTINSFDNQSFTGVLHRTSTDYVVLLNGETQFFIRKDHITNIFQGFIKLEEKENENNNENESNSENAQSNEDSSTNSENPQNDVANANLNSNNTPSEKNNKLDRKKHHEIVDLKEVKFNSPMQGCTWNTRKKRNFIDVSESKKAEKASVDEQPIQELKGDHGNLDKPNKNNAITKKAENIDEENKNNSKAKNEITNEPIMTMEDNRVLMEKQYYALMKFAENMKSLEKQYQTLMRHAEKMYLQYRKNRQF